jgi:hypothetical protein
MQFRLTTLFYVVTVVAVALVAFGPWFVLPLAFVTLFWFFCVFDQIKSRRATIISSFLSVTLALLFYAGVVLFVGHAAKSGRRGGWCAHNMHNVVLAVELYAQTHGCYPPPYLADENGKPLHSWRVLILPQLGEQNLFDEYDFDEPWDGPNNRRLARRMPRDYRCPDVAPDDDMETTSYLAVVGANTMWPVSGQRVESDVTDGLDNTILLVEAPHAGIHWMEPRDLRVQDIRVGAKESGERTITAPHRIDGLFSYKQYWNALFADKYPRRMDASVPGTEIEKLATINDGDGVAHTLWPLQEHWKLGKIIAWLAFFVLALAPAVPLAKRQFRRKEQTSGAESETTPTPADDGAQILTESGTSSTK